MVLLRVLAGKSAGRELTARRLPLRIGRAPESHLRLEDEGVWERHCEIVQPTRRGLAVRSDPSAATLLNHHRIVESSLRNGDVLEVGAAKLQFWLAPPRQTGLRWRETLTWVAIFGLAAVQAAACYWLIR